LLIQIAPLIILSFLTIQNKVFAGAIKTGINFMQTTDYKTSGKFHVRTGTPTKICSVLNRAYVNRDILKFYWGDVNTGIPWGEENDIIGYIGRSTGQINVPLLVEPGHTGGSEISTDCILAIKEILTGIYVYIADNYQPLVVTIGPSLEPGYKFSTFINGKLYGNHKTKFDALICKDKLS